MNRSEMQQLIKIVADKTFTSKYNFNEKASREEALYGWQSNTTFSSYKV